MIDAVRGLACIWMIAWHTADSWLLDSVRDDSVFVFAMRVGGVAAPWFFLLAGVASGLTEAPERPASDRAASGLMRAGQIVVLGYALKLFALGVDRGGLADARAPFVVLGALGLSASYAALGSLGWLPEAHRSRLLRGTLLAIGIGLFLAMVFGFRDDPEASELVQRLDVLQGLGASLAVVTLLLVIDVRGGARIGLVVVAALVVVLVTPALSAAGPRTPVWMQHWLDYVVRWPPFPLPSGARFPFFPWLGYMLLGAGVGRALRGRSPDGEFGLPGLRGTTRPALRTLAVLAISLTLTTVAFEESALAQAVLGFGELPRNLFRLTFYASMAVAAAALVALVARAAQRGPRFLALMGRHSLAVYAVHLEIAYGLPTVPLTRSLHFGAWLALAALLTLAMAGLAAFLERAPRRGRAASTSRGDSQA